jgi:hypothetical protein
LLLIALIVGLNIEIIDLVALYSTEQPYKYRGFVKVIRIVVIVFKALAVYKTPSRDKAFQKRMSRIFSEKDFRRLGLLLERLKQTNDPVQFLTEISWACSVFGAKENDNMPSEINLLRSKSSLSDIDIVTPEKPQAQHFGKIELFEPSRAENISEEFEMNGKVSKIMEDIDCLSFNTLKLHKESQGDDVACILVTLFDRFEICNGLGLKRNILIKMSRFISVCYKDNPYHNQTHAADIAQVLLFLTF